MNTKSFTRSFAGGELAPQLFGRLDLTKFQTGLQKCLNFMVTPQGPVENRAGFEYVVRARSAGAALIPFTYNSEQSFALEFGAGYIRFHTNGGTLLETAKSITAITRASPGVFTRAAHGYTVGKWVFLASIGGMPELSNRWAIVASVPSANTFTLTDLFGAPIDTSGMAAYTGGGTVSAVYEISSPYASGDVFELHYVQSADVLTISHQDHATRELRRLGATNWTLTTVSFSPTISTPSTPTATAGGPGGGTAEDHTYVVTALAADTLEESLASPPATASRDLSVSGNYVEIQPTVVAGTIRYNVYKLQSGIYGYIGQTDGSAFRDSNIVPDMSKTPPLLANPFAVGAISGVDVTAGGAGYNTATPTGGVIDSVTVTNGGSGYTAATASASGGGSGATFTVNVVMGAVVSVTIDNGGSLYETPTITITGDGTGATATATATDITAPPTVTLGVSGGGGSGAVLEPVVVGGAIIGVRIVAPGSGYSAPVVTVTEAAGGAGATFSVSVTGSDVHPQAVSYFEQRRCFGGTAGSPQNVWMTRSGTERNMTYSIPTQDDDAIAARIVAREANVVRHLVPLNDLLAFTSGGVWRLASASGDALTPANLSAKPQSYVGASMVQPMVTSSSVLYAPDRGSHIRELSYKWESQSYQADDVSVLAPHLFDYKGVVQIAYSKTPNQVLWVVRDDGVLLGLTYQPEHEVKAWHQHDTQGLFKSVCAIPEGDEDGIYVIVQRTIDGQAVQYIERMHTRQFSALEDAFFVDAGATYEGTATDTISGLWHLEGMEVVALADGGVEPVQTVENGTITLSAEASKVHVGLAYNSDAQTMPLSIEAARAFGQGTLKNVNEVALRVYQSSGLKAGPSFDKLREYPQRTADDNYGAPPGMVTGIAQFKLDPSWQRDGTVCVRQSNPLPLTLLAITVEAASGG